MKIAKAIAFAILGVFCLVAGVALGARFADGPVAVFPGGPLQSGEWIDAERIDWTFAADIQEIEFESGGRSRTVWLLVHQGEAYIPCSLGFPPGKSWHHEILDRPEAVLRIEGKRYRRKLVRVDDEALRATLADVVLSKYTPPPSEGGAWFFHVQPR